MLEKKSTILFKKKIFFEIDLFFLFYNRIGADRQHIDKIVAPHQKKTNGQNDL